jgi:hypothetical protein
LGAEVLVLPRLSIIGRLESDRFRHEGEEVPAGVRALDRTDTSALTGVVYRIGQRITVGAQTVSYDSDFVNGPDRDGYVHLATFRFEGNRLFVDSALGRRNLDADQELAQGYDDFTGSYFASLRSLGGSAVEVSGRRGLEYSIAEDALYYLDIRNGLAGTLRLGTRTALRLSAEAGQNEYPPSGGSRGERIDDVVTIGGGVSIRLFRTARLGIVVSRSDYDSTFPEFNRSVTRVVTTFSLRGEVF